MSVLRRLFVSALAASAASLALAVPVQPASAAGGPVTQIMVWGDSMTQVWPGYLKDLLGIPVQPNGVGGHTVQDTQRLFNEWLAAATPADRAATGHICWCGHVNTNRKHAGDPLMDEDSIVPTLQEMAGRVPTGYFMPIGLTNGPDQGMGTAGYEAIVRAPERNVDRAVNEDMYTAMRPLYAEVRGYLVESGLADARIDPTPEDLANIKADIPPRSLRTDNPDANPSHLNDAGRRVTAGYLANLIRDRGWVTAEETKSPSETFAFSTPNPSTKGQFIRVSVTVTSAAQTQSETPTGKIQFVVNGKPYGSPMTLKADGTLLSPQSSRLGVGTHFIRAEYSGDAIFGPSNSSFTHEVTAAP